MLNLLAQVAALAGAASGLEATADRRRLGGILPAVTVSQVTPSTPTLPGDGRLGAAEAIVLQVSVWQTRDDEDDARISSIIAALDGVKPAGGGYAMHVEGTLRLPDPEDDVIQTAISLRYARSR